MAGGRPSKYKPEFPAQARKLCALGATNPELADFFGVHPDTIDEWQNVHPEFSEALKEAKEQLDAKVERRLFERAMGYSHPAVKMFQAGGSVITEQYTEHYPPDTTAAIFWLKNRRPEQWRDVKDVNMNVRRDARDLSDDDLHRIATGGGAGAADEAASKKKPARVH